MSYISRDIDLLSWIKRGKQRRDLIKHIKDHLTPSELAKESGYSLNHASRILNEFSRKGLTKCLNPKAKTGRLYVLTQQGRKVKDALAR